jgi:hypothetical protein
MAKAFRSVVLLMIVAVAACGGGGSAPESDAVGSAPEPMATGSARLTWYAPTTNEDGSRLEDLAGFAVYYGESDDLLSQRIWIANPSAITWTVTNLPLGTWYFAVTAVNARGYESGFSNIVVKSIG